MAEGNLKRINKYMQFSISGVVTKEAARPKRILSLDLVGKRLFYDCLTIIAIDHTP